MVVRHSSTFRSPIALFWLLFSIALPSLLAIPAQAEEALPAANPLTTPRTLKDAGIAPSQIVGQTPETPSPSPASPQFR